MKAVYLVAKKGLVPALTAAFFIFSGAVAETTALPAQLTSSDKPTVYVSDFDLDVLPVDAARNPSTATPSPVSADARKQSDEARKQAARIVDLMATNLVQALQKAGYTAVRLHSGDGRPDHGMRIRGLFAEADKENHWRRAVIRGASDSGKIQALVSVADLDKPEQALYEIANLPGNSNKPGAVITLSPYVPLEKFDFDKDAPDDAFQKTAAHIVNDVTALLRANPTAASQ